MDGESYSAIPWFQNHTCKFIIFFGYIHIKGVEGVVRGLKGVHRADRCMYTNRMSNATYSNQVCCMSSSWLLGNVYMAKSCKGLKRDTDALKLGLVS
jgi:hypothetical protein